MEYSLYINNNFMTTIDYVAEGAAKHYIGYDDRIWGNYLTIRKKNVESNFDFSNFEKYIENEEIYEIRIENQNSEIIYKTNKYTYLRSCELFRLDTEKNAMLNTFICIFAIRQ